MPQGRGEIKSRLEVHGIRPAKRLGQNFLADPNLVDRIVRTANIGSGDRVVEVGAGTGTLTRALADTGATVISYEVDHRLEPLLREVLAGSEVDLRMGDVGEVDLAMELGTSSWVMIANLPYNVGTPLLLDALRGVPSIERFVVMVQREVADRLTAQPGSRAYGLPSIVVALHAEAHLAFRVPPEVFYPVPDVESAVVEFTRRPAPAAAERAIELATVAFQQRRKMLRRSLGSALLDPEAALAAAAIPATARPEDTAAAAFVRLAEVAP
jgi:16S rRNA (adenine1518-N6/adenine1519-N6)-dimethyltransferase